MLLHLQMSCTVAAMLLLRLKAYHSCKEAKRLDIWMRKIELFVSKVFHLM